MMEKDRRNREKELTNLIDKIGDEEYTDKEIKLLERESNRDHKKFINSNMVIFRAATKKRCMEYNKKNFRKGSWRNVLIEALQVRDWEEVRATELSQIIGGTINEMDGVLDHCDLGFSYCIDNLVWSTGSNYTSKKDKTFLDKMKNKKRFDRRKSFLFGDSVVEINYDVVSDDGGKNMGNKFLDEIGVRRLKKRVSKKDLEEKNRVKVNDLTLIRKGFVSYINEIINHLNGVDEKYGNNVKNAVKENKNSGNYEISLVRNNIPLMFGNSRYLEVSGKKGDVISKLSLIKKGIEDGKLDSVLKAHKKRCSNSKKSLTNRT